MAEFCLECYNEMYDENLTKRDVVLIKDFCEGCGEVKPCVIRIKNKYSVFGFLIFLK